VPLQIFCVTSCANIRLSLLCSHYYCCDTYHSAKTGAFVITGSSDRTLKRYELDGIHLRTTAAAATATSDSSSSSDDSIERMRAKVSVIAHEKDINGVAISPNDGIVATAR
jgi:WD40 repeat protein